MLRLVEIANEVLPPGVLNAVPGLAAGAALAGHPLVERISFTGATATGRRVLETAAQNLTYATMELGGKNALIVFPDADLDVAVEVSIEGMFYNQGEACTSTARILVHDDVYDEFLERFTAAATALVVGDGLDPRTDIGPWWTPCNATVCWPTCGQHSRRVPAWSDRATCRPIHASPTAFGYRRPCWPM